MFNATDTVIDTVTTAQKQAIKFIQNEAIAKTLSDLVDAQAQSAKTAVKVSTDAFTTVSKEMVKAAQETAKYDYSKYFAETAESFAKVFTPAKSK